MDLTSEIDRNVSAALAEDIGIADWTALLTPEDRPARATVTCRSAAVVCGHAWFEGCFTKLDPNSRVTWRAAEGESLAAGSPVCEIEGDTRALLTGERTALNFLGRLSGIATLTAAFVAAVEGTPARIAETRKTTPGLRAFEKYAVRAGGGVNHRFGLYDAVLVKDNHVAAAGGIANALAKLQARVGHLVKIEVEVDTLAELDQALKFPIDAVLLDNMDVETLKAAVALVKGRMVTEASGGVSLETVGEIAKTGVDVISVGALTNAPRSLDSSLEWARS